MSVARCNKCGGRIDFVPRWRPSERLEQRWVVIDPEPDPLAIESFVEVAKETFVSVFRHKCVDKADANE
jgi:hypothetical protein